MGKRKSKNKKIVLLLLAIIIPFLGFLGYFLVNGSNPFPLLGSLFGEYTPRVKYETFKVYIDDSISESVVNNIKESVSDIQFNGRKRFDFVDEKRAEYVLGISEKEDESFVTRQLIPVGHIYWVKGSVTSKELSGSTVYMEEGEYIFANEYISELYNVDIKLVDSVTDELKKSEKNIAFVFPSNLSEELKVLEFDKKNILDDGVGIKMSYTLNGGKDSSFVGSILSSNIDWFANDTIDMNEVVKINMTGVTAISRGLAVKINSSGDWGYPARDIGKFLADADLTHTSNEASFVQGCNAITGMRFCSRPEYIEILKDSGIDIVELTGNHNNDFGASNNAKSIETYKSLGWDYFGGGLNTQDSSKILYKEAKGSRIAFLGYNYYDTMLNTGAIAGADRAGANSYSVDKLKSNILEAKKNADVVIVTFQFQECYSYPPSDVIYPICYKPLSSPDQKGVFRQAIDFGADIVVGTQAHQPQTYEIYKDGVIFYGLGNIYFDQSRWIGTRQGLVLSIYILGDKVIQTRLTPTIYDTDLIPRVADQEDGDLLLNLLKSARNF